ncbi:hypothetical protein LJR045_002602 [Microbacterium sp. LjRoot45]|uniref:hypothetical protein n=1 Tax=Microbacterium sp. LjRoot45 TaxID=3342329 RepID=UPI003ECE8711
MSPRRGRASRPARAEADGSVLRWPGAAQRFALFGEVLWIGALMAVVCLPVVTWPAAVAAGSAHLRRFLAAEATPASGFFRDAVRALPGGIGVGVVTTALGTIVAVDVALTAEGTVPGGMLVAVVVATIGLAALVGATIASSLWTPGASWRDLVRITPRVARADLSGTAYTVVALGLAATIVWQFLPLVIPVLGLLSFALVSIGERRMVRLTAAAARRDAGGPRGAVEGLT